MAVTTLLLLTTVLTLLGSSSSAQISTPPSPSPAPAPSPHLVNLTALLSVAGPFHTFLNYLVQTKVIQTFQSQANNTDQGITIFVPKDSAFSSLKTPSLTNLTNDQLKSLLLFHAFPKYYTLSDFKNLSSSNPVSTLAGGQYNVNVTDASGLVRIGSGWSNPKVTSSVLATDPVAIYEVDRVLIPEAIFGSSPVLPPAPAPAPDVTPASDLAPGGSADAPKASASSATDSSSSWSISAGVVKGLVFAFLGGLVVML